MVDYDVILKAQYTSNYEDVFQEIKSNVQEKILNATKVQVSGTNDINCTGKALLEGRALRGWPLKPLDF